MKLDVAFVCQSGHLEAQSALLAASIRNQCGDQAYLHVLEPIPEEEYGAIAPATRRFLNDLGAKWYQFRNPISDEYKVFNKLNAFNIQPQGDRILFLDSDILVRRPLEGLQSYRKYPFAAKCGFQQAFSAEPEDWKPIYELFDLPVPTMRWPASDSHEWGPPYFSAAVILVDPVLDFSKCLIDTCLTIHQNADALQLKKLGTAQIGLSVAPYRLHAACALLDSRFNFALTGRRLKSFNSHCGYMAGHIFHYGSVSRLLKTPYLLYEVYQLYKRFKVSEVLEQQPAWQTLLLTLEGLDENPAEVDRLKPQSSFWELPNKNESAKHFSINPESKPLAAPKRRAVFITEIPHGGARLFAKLLAKLPNLTVLAEPRPAGEFSSFEEWAAAIKNWRAQIEGEGAHQASAILATQHEASCLAHLDALLKIFPEAMVFIVVRNPMATIAQWRNVPGLKQAGMIETDRLAGIHAPGLAENRQQQLAELQKLDEPMMQRAGLWNYFAGLADTHDERIQIFRYEDLIANPRAVLEHLGATLFPGQNFKLPDLEPRLQEQDAGAAMTERERECIRAACSYSAGAFGYNLYVD
jgi:hypothetical protein